MKPRSGLRWRREKGQMRMARRVGPSHPRLYFTIFLCSFLFSRYVS